MRSVAIAAACLLALACSRRAPGATGASPAGETPSAEPSVPSEEWLSFAADQAAYAERLEMIVAAHAIDDDAVARARAALGDDLDAVRSATPDDWLFVRAKADADLAALARAFRDIDARGWSTRRAKR